jgi:hypothetical protein
VEVEVPTLGVPNQRAVTWGILRYDIQSYRRQRSLIPDKYDITGTIQMSKGQILANQTGLLAVRIFPNLFKQWN